jgi:hypothetical protein
MTNWETSAKFELFDMTGQLLFSDTWDNSRTDHTIDLSHYSPGIYFYKLQDRSSTFDGKIIKIN